MKKGLLRLMVYVLSLAVFVGGLGFLGFSQTQKEFYASLREEPVPALDGITIPPHDPKKPTVAVILGPSSITTEDFDFLIPYTLFSMTEAYNVYAVAPDHDIKSLSGGLDVIPHYTYAELDALLATSPDVIIIPFMPILDDAAYAPTREWIQKHSFNETTTFLSICGGSGNMADAGLLQGKSAASHWQAIPSLRTFYPDTNWVEDVRYVHEGNTVATAGQTAGIDGVLHLISQQVGEPMAAKIAKDISYPNYEFVANPKVEPFVLDYKFSTYILNSAFRWNKKQMGVLLYDGMEELALSSIFDTYADTGTTRVRTISGSDAPLATKYHLNIVARHTIENAPALDKMIIPGGDAAALAHDDIQLWNETGKADVTLLIHADSPERYVFEAPLEDLARQEDLLTARHGVKRLEYRADNIRLEGRALPYMTYVHLLLSLVLGFAAAFLIDRKFIAKKPFYRLHKRTL